jgi:hypothetical protein
MAVCLSVYFLVSNCSKGDTLTSLDSCVSPAERTQATKQLAHPMLSTLARSKAVDALAGMLAENEHLAYVATRAGEHKCRGKKADCCLGAS